MSALSPIEKHTLWEDFSVRGPVRAFVLFLLCELSWPDVRKTVALADSTVYECFGGGGEIRLFTREPQICSHSLEPYVYYVHAGT